MIRRVVADLYQIGEHVETSFGFEAVRTYILLNGGRPILVDCGSHLHREEIMSELHSLLGDTVPEYLFLTHSELPHAGNMASVAQKWPGIKVLVSSVMLPYIEVLPVLPPEQMIQVKPGSQIELPLRTFEFVDALLKDQPGSQWIYDSLTATLFTGDGFGYFHPSDAIDRFSDEIEGGITAAQFQDYHHVAFRFLRWIEPDRLNRDLDHMFRRRTIDVIAPIHGSAIRSEIPLHLRRIKQALAGAQAEYDT